MITYLILEISIRFYFNLSFCPVTSYWWCQSPYVLFVVIVIVKFVYGKEVNFSLILKCVNIFCNFVKISIESRYFEENINYITCLFKTIITLIVYQKVRHSCGCSFPTKPGVISRVVALLASLSSDPAIAKIFSAEPVWSRKLYHG